MIDPPTADLVADGSMSVADSLTFTGLSRAGLYREMEAGRIAFAQNGRRRLVLRASLREWLAARVVHPPTTPTEEPTP